MGKYIYIADTETTGLDPEQHEIIELCLCKVDINNPEDFEIKTWLLKATNPETITDEALRVNGHKRDDILHVSKSGREKYQNPVEAISDIETWIYKDDTFVSERVLAGQNIQFDFNMLKSLWKRHDNLDTFPFPLEAPKLIDTLMFTLLVDVCTGKTRQHYNLSSLVKDFNIKTRKAHKAEEDVLMTKDLLLAQILPIKDVLIEKFSHCYENTL